MPSNFVFNVMILFGLINIQTIEATPIGTSCKQLIVGSADNWYPYAYVDKNNVHRGIGFDIVKLVSSDINISLKFETGLPWSRTIAEVDEGKIDILSANYWTKERSEQLLMTHEIANESLHVFSLKTSNFVFNQWQDLIGKQGVMPRGMALGEKFGKFALSLNLKEVNTHHQIFRILNSGRADYIILARKSAQPYLVLQENSDVFMHKEPINLYSVRISFSRQSACLGLFNKFNQQLKERIHDGSIADIIAMYPLK